MDLTGRAQGGAGMKLFWPVSRSRFWCFFGARFWGRNSACLLYLYWERILRAQKRVNFWGPKLGHFLHKKLAYFAQEVGLFLSKFGLSGQLALAKLAVRPAVQGTALAAEFPAMGKLEREAT